MLDAFLLFEVTYFSFSAKAKHDITKLPKLYCIDNGFINIVNMKYSKNRGQMFENTVFIKLLETYKEISYWSELNTEIDFIVDNRAINVTATDIIPPRESKGLEEFSKKFPRFSKKIICPTLETEDTVGILNFLKE